MALPPTPAQASSQRRPKLPLLRLSLPPLLHLRLSFSQCPMSNVNVALLDAVAS